MNIRSLRFHQEEPKLLLDTLEQKPAVLLLTEKWVAKNDPIEYNDGYHTIYSNPRLDCRRRSGGAALYIKEGIS